MIEAFGLFSALVAATPEAQPATRSQAQLLASATLEGLKTCSKFFDGPVELPAGAASASPPDYVINAFSQSSAGRAAFSPTYFRLPSAEGEVWMAIYLMSSACSVAVANTSEAYPASVLLWKSWEEASVWKRIGSSEPSVQPAPWKRIYVRQTATDSSPTHGIMMSARGANVPLENGQMNQMQVHFIAGEITIDGDNVTLSRKPSSKAK